MPTMTAGMVCSLVGLLVGMSLPWVFVLWLLNDRYAKITTRLLEENRELARFSVSMTASATGNLGAAALMSASSEAAGIKQANGSPWVGLPPPPSEEDLLMRG